MKVLRKQKKQNCATLDTEKDTAGLLELGKPKSAAHRMRACDTLHLGWAMRAGTAKRSRLFWKD